MNRTPRFSSSARRMSHSVSKSTSGPALDVDDTGLAAGQLQLVVVEAVALEPAREAVGQAVEARRARRTRSSSRCSMTSNCRTPTAPRMGSRSSRRRSKKSCTAPSSESWSSPFLSCLRFSGSSSAHAHEVLGREARDALELDAARPRTGCRRCAGRPGPTARRCRRSRPRRPRCAPGP